MWRRRVAYLRRTPRFAWVRTRPGVSAPIVGATKLSHLDDAIASLEIELTDDEILKLEGPYMPHPVLGH